MFYRAFLVIALVFGFASVAAAHEGGSKSDYAKLVDRVKAGDATVDYRALRFAADSVEADRDIKREMHAALQRGDNKKAAEAAERIIAETFANIDAHIVAAISYEKLGNATKHAFHDTIARGLIQSIVKSGDGKSAKTAFVVVAVEEEYLMLALLGIRHSSQSVTTVDGHRFDVMEGVDTASEKPATTYFNIDAIWARYEKIFGK